MVDVTANNTTEKLRWFPQHIKYGFSAYRMSYRIAFIERKPIHKFQPMYIDVYGLTMREVTVR